jgi:hypothetical protein
MKLLLFLHCEGKLAAPSAEEKSSLCYTLLKYTAFGIYYYGFIIYYIHGCEHKGLEVMLNTDALE